MTTDLTAVKSFDAAAACRRVLQLADELESSVWADTQPWMVARLIRIAVANDLKAGLTAEPAS